MEKGRAGVTLAGCQPFLARRLNQSHGQVGRPSFLGNGGLLPNCVLEMSWKSGQTKYSKKWDSLCVFALVRLMFTSTPYDTGLPVTKVRGSS